MRTNVRRRGGRKLDSINRDPIETLCHDILIQGFKDWIIYESWKPVFDRLRREGVRSPNWRNFGYEKESKGRTVLKLKQLYLYPPPITLPVCLAARVLGLEREDVIKLYTTAKPRLENLHARQKVYGRDRRAIALNEPATPKKRKVKSKQSRKRSKPRGRPKRENSI